jgi:hypothetical protein
MHGLFWLRGYGLVAWTLPHTFRSFQWFPVLLSLSAMPVVAAGEALRLRSWSGAGEYLRAVASWGWWRLTLRIWLGIVLTIHVYVWLKLYVPYLNPALFDGALWQIEERLAFGVSPNILLLELFKAPWVLRTVDWSYARVFEAGLYLIMMLFPALRSNPLRLAVATSFVLVWTLGGWLHVLVPALGPCYWFPAVWKPYAGWLRETAAMQAALWKNYQAMTVLRHVEGVRVHPIFGVAAFPSMHNASHVLLALWVGRLDRRAGWAVWSTVGLIFLGSVITGWHYVSDGVAGLLLAAACYAACARALRPPRRHDA